MFSPKPKYEVGEIVKAPFLKYILRGKILSIEENIYTVEIPCYYCNDEHSVIVKVSYNQLQKVK